jgi:hypothetical protein
MRQMSEIQNQIGGDHYRKMAIAVGQRGGAA